MTTLYHPCELVIMVPRPFGLCPRQHSQSVSQSVSLEPPVSSGCTAARLQSENAAFCHPRTPRFPSVGARWLRRRPTPDLDGWMCHDPSTTTGEEDKHDGLTMIQDWRACMCHSCSWIFFCFPLPSISLVTTIFFSSCWKPPSPSPVCIIYSLWPTSAATTDERVRLMR